MWRIKYSVWARKVRKAYYEAVGAKQVEDMRRLIAHAATVSYEAAQKIYQAGNVSDLMLAGEQMQYERARMDLAKSSEEVSETREKMNRLMGLWGPRTDWKIPDKLPEPPREELPLDHVESLAVANRLDLAAARQEVKVRGQSLEIAQKWRWIASADVGVSSELDTDGQWVTGPVLSLELPIFDQHQAKIFRLEAQFRQSSKRMTALAVEIRSEVRALRNRLLMKRNLIDHYRNVTIPLSERIVDLTQKEYNYMLAGVFELLTAKKDEFDTCREYIEATRDYWVIRSELQQAVGGYLPAPAGPESRLETDHGN